MAVEVDGLTLSLCAARLPATTPGARRRLLLIHGNPGPMDTWGPLAERLRHHGEVLAFDLPGLGRSDAAPASMMTLGGLARISLALGEAMAPGSPLELVGHSHGGAVALVAAATEPSRCQSATLLATLGAAVPWSYRVLQAPGLDALLGAVGHLMGIGLLRPWALAATAMFMTPLFMPEGLPPDAAALEVDRVAARPDRLARMAQLTAGAPWEVLRAHAPRLGVPALFLHGAADALVPVAFARQLHAAAAAHNPHTGFRVIPGAGHMLPAFHAETIARSMARHFDWPHSPTA